MFVVTSGQPPVLPLSVPVTPQSITPSWSAGITSGKGMLTPVAPTPPRKSIMVLLNTRIFLPLRSASVLIVGLHQNTCCWAMPMYISRAFQLCCIRRSSTGRYALQAARTLSISRAMPARSQPSKRGSSAASRLKSVVPKSIPPCFSRRRIAALSSPSCSNGTISPVTMPPDAGGIVSRQKGCSSLLELMIALSSPTPFTWVRGRFCAWAGAAKATAAAASSLTHLIVSLPPRMKLRRGSLQASARGHRPDGFHPAVADTVHRVVQVHRRIRVADDELQRIAHAQRGVRHRELDGRVLSGQPHRFDAL